MSVVRYLRRGGAAMRARPRCITARCGRPPPRRTRRSRSSSSRSTSARVRTPRKRVRGSIVPGTSSWAARLWARTCGRFPRVRRDQDGSAASTASSQGGTTASIGLTADPFRQRLRVGPVSGCRRGRRVALRPPHGRGNDCKGQRRSGSPQRPRPGSPGELCVADCAGAIWKSDQATRPGSGSRTPRSRATAVSACSSARTGSPPRPRFQNDKHPAAARSSGSAGSKAARDRSTS